MTSLFGNIGLPIMSPTTLSHDRSSHHPHPSGTMGYFQCQSTAAAITNAAAKQQQHHHSLMPPP